MPLSVQELAASYGNALPNGMPYGVGLSLMLPGGGSLPWPTNWPGANRIQDVDQKVWLTQASAGIQPHPLFKLGASLLYYRVQEKLAVQILDAGAAQLGLAGGAFTYGVAGEFHAPEGIPLTIAIDYKHQAPLELTGRAHFDNIPGSLTAQLHDQNATEHVTAPNILYIGAAYELVPNLKVMGSWNLERWKSYTSDTYLGESGGPLVSAQLQQRVGLPFRRRVREHALPASADVAARALAQHLRAAGVHHRPVAHRREQLGGVGRRQIRIHPRSAFRRRLPVRILR